MISAMAEWTAVAEWTSRGLDGSEAIAAGFAVVTADYE